MKRQLAQGALIAIASLTACDEGQKSPPPGKSATRAQSSVAAEPKEAPKPWFVGSWKGEYDAQRFLIEMSKKQGAVRSWSEDDGAKATGKGKLEVSVDETGSITGTASGPLGKQMVVGQVEGEEFRLRLRPEQPGEGAFSGTLLVEKKAGQLTGRLQASSGDSLVVRDAPVTLKKSSDSG